MAAITPELPLTPKPTEPPGPGGFMRRMTEYAQLLRLDRPIGTWLLVWPMLWALWIAAEGHPQRRLLAIFIAGAVLMRSAGCIINDLVDRNIDPHVRRTRSRPLATRAISPPEALTVFAVLVAAALLLVLPAQCIHRTAGDLPGAALTITYPVLKRFFPLPQLYLGFVLRLGGADGVRRDPWRGAAHRLADAGGRDPLGRRLRHHVRDGRSRR